MIATKTGPVTADELWDLSHQGKRYELVKGELRELAPAGPEHGFVSANLIVRIGQFVQDGQLGVMFSSETGFIVRFGDEETVRAPDAAFIAYERIPAEGIPKRYWDIAPDLVVEVTSPGDTYSDVVEKVEDWLQAGVRMVLVVEPRLRQVSVYRPGQPVRLLRSEDVLSGEDVLPGFQCPVSDIFAMPVLSPLPERKGSE